MKRFLTLGIGLALAASMTAQETTGLPAPDLTRPATLMQALSDRHSTRTFAETALTDNVLADLLWAANGVNRPDEGKRTAPSAMNRQEVDIYVLRADGAYRYDAAANALTRVGSEDLRPAVAGRQASVAAAPVCLVLVADLSKFGDPPSDQSRLMCAVDVGIVSQNVSLFCSAAGLATVPRAGMDTDALRKGLGLADGQLPIINHPVGYPAP